MSIRAIVPHQFWMGNRPEGLMSKVEDETGTVKTETFVASN
jgi:hypothetical protein